MQVFISSLRGSLATAVIQDSFLFGMLLSPLPKGGD